MTRHKEKKCGALVLGYFGTTMQNIFFDLIYDTAFDLNKISDL